MAIAKSWIPDAKGVRDEEEGKVGGKGTDKTNTRN